MKKNESGGTLLKLKDKFSKDLFSIGLDIGTQAVKLVELKFSKDTVQLCRFVLEPASLDLGPLLKRIAASRAVNISVSGPATIIRYVNFPLMNEDELKQALKFEAQKHIPFKIDEVNLDTHILKEAAADKKMIVLVAAAKKELINQRLKLVQDAGLKPNIIDIDSLALINAFQFNYSEDGDNLKNQTISLLNIGGSISNLNILEDGLPVLSRDMHIAGNNFMLKVKDLGMDFKSIEELELNDKDKFDKVVAAYEPVASDLSKEVRSSFDYYETQGASSVNKIFLSGRGSKLPGLKDTLASTLGIAVEYWDPFRKIKVEEGVDSKELMASSSQLAVAVGLALRK